MIDANDSGCYGSPPNYRVFNGFRDLIKPEMDPKPSSDACQDPDPTVSYQYVCVLRVTGLRSEKVGINTFA